MSDDIAYHCYTPETIPCPNCTMCGDHSEKAPRVTVRTRYYRVMKNGDRQEMTKQEYAERQLH